MTANPEQPAWEKMPTPSELFGSPEGFTLDDLRWDLNALRADSRSAPGIDSINPANGEQPRL